MKVSRRDIEKFSQILVEEGDWEKIVEVLGAKRACEILETLVRKGEVKVEFPISDRLSSVELKLKESPTTEDDLEALKRVVNLTLSRKS